ncbi:MAG: LptF/LptG family permease [Nitrospinales bacterium]
MKKIHKYIFNEVMKWFLLSIFILTGILFIVKSLIIIDLIANHGMSVVEGVKVIFFILPTFLSVTIPPSLFLATLISFAGFSVKNEYTAMRTSGWDYFFLMRPILLISGSAFIFTNIVIFYFLPLGTNSLKVFLFDVFQKKSHIEMKPRVFYKKFPGYVLYFKNLDSKGHLLSLIVSSRLPSESPKIIFAKIGVLVPNPETLKMHLKMTNGVVHQMDKVGKAYSTSNFENFELQISFPDQTKLINNVLSGGVVVNESSASELWLRIKNAEREGVDLYWKKVVLSRKFSIPFSCLIFGLAGVPVGIGRVRSRRFENYFKGVLIIGTYYFFMMVVQKIGAIGTINPYLSVWIPNILLGCFTFYSVSKACRDESGARNYYFNFVYEKFKKNFKNNRT